MVYHLPVVLIAEERVSVKRRMSEVIFTCQGAPLARTLNFEPPNALSGRDCCLVCMSQCMIDCCDAFTTVAGSATCVLTLYILYCMLFARTPGIGIQRLPAAALPLRSRAFLNTLPFPPRPHPTTPYDKPLTASKMLRGAVQRHEKENGTAKPASQGLFKSSPPEQPNTSSQSNNPGYRNPLKPTTASALNGSRAWQQPRASAGMKRTASGLAKACDGAFDDGPGSRQQPITVGSASAQKAGLVQVTQNEFVDADDFDSDIDLDVEEPLPKKAAVSYPSLPQQRPSASPTKPVFYPTLPRQQAAQTTAARDIDSGYGSVEPHATKNPPPSSAPLPWSSSPAEHFQPAKQFLGKPFMYRAGAQSAQNGPPPPQPEPRASARRKLPWLEEKKEEATTQPVSSTVSKSKSVAGFTPLPKDSKKSIYPWNTSASAVKEQQKKHREENKRAMKTHEPDENTLRKAKSAQQRPARVFLSEEQQHVLSLVLDKKSSVFFTGSAGTGKSVLMREIIAALRKNYSREPDRVAVTASTGLAACNVGGVTLHSFAGIGLGKEDVPELVRKIKKNQKARHRWMRTKVLIVDEVSMVDGELFDKLEAIARTLRNNGRPFGGIQIVVTGDFFQLPPVPDSGRAARFAFDAGTWKTTIEHTIALHHVFRQKDPSKCCFETLPMPY